MVPAHLVIEEGEQVADDPVGVQRDVEDFLRIGAPAVADRIIARETEAKQVGNVVLAQSLRDDGLLGQPQQDVVAERRVVQRLVVTLPRVRRDLWPA